MTAQEAKDLYKSYSIGSEKDIQKKLKSIYKQISDKCIEQKEQSINLYVSIYPNTHKKLIKELEKQGYTIIKHNIFKNITYYTINW